MHRPLSYIGLLLSGAGWFVGRASLCSAYLACYIGVPMQGLTGRGINLAKTGYEKIVKEKQASCHVGRAGTHLISKVKQRWARLVLGWVTAQMTSKPGAV
jgi:hypothetical protein